LDVTERYVGAFGEPAAGQRCLFARSSSGDGWRDEEQVLSEVAAVRAEAAAGRQNEKCRMKKQRPPLTAVLRNPAGMVRRG